MKEKNGRKEMKEIKNGDEKKQMEERNKEIKECK